VHSCRRRRAGARALLPSAGLPEIEKPVALNPNGGLWLQIADIPLHIGVESGAGTSKRHPTFKVDHLERAPPSASAGRHYQRRDSHSRHRTILLSRSFGNRISSSKVL
jgi:hypothetical protein